MDILETKKIIGKRTLRESSFWGGFWSAFDFSKFLSDPVEAKPIPSPSESIRAAWDNAGMHLSNATKPWND